MCRVQAMARSVGGQTCEVRHLQQEYVRSPTFSCGGSYIEIVGVLPSASLFRCHQVEIVAFGPGLRLLFDGNANSGRIKGLAGSGVKFSACANTVTNMGKILGKPPALNSNAVSVSAGVVRIIELVDQGYQLVKP